MTVSSAPPDAEPVRCTVAIPVYNRKDMVMRAVDSALAQPMRDLEVLVVDNCSTDGTWELLQRRTDQRLRLVRNAGNVGLFGNFNRCLELASGTYVRFLCSDDVLAPECLPRELALLEAHPTTALLSTTARRVRATGEVIGPLAAYLPPGRYPGRAAIAGILRFKAEYGLNPLNYPSGILLRTEAARRAGPFDTTMRMSADMDLFLRMLSEGELLVVADRGCDITIHEQQEGARLSGAAVVMEEEYLLLERHGEALGSPRTVQRVADLIGGFCLRFAIQAWYRGDRASARQHLDLARAHGSSVVAMTRALARIIALRVLAKVLGIRLLPEVFKHRIADRDQRATSAAPGAVRGTTAERDARGA